jgi:hypothetical protein
MKTILFFLAAMTLSVIAHSQPLKPVKWTYSARKISPTEALISMKATIEKGWHIYGLNVPEGGPAKTSFTFEPAKNYSVIDATTEPKPHTHFEKAFEMNVDFFENSVVFGQHIKLTGKNAKIKGSVRFMIRSERQCLPPQVSEFSVLVE